jgi:hypothetical protein
MLGHLPHPSSSRRSSKSNIHTTHTIVTTTITITAPTATDTPAAEAATARQANCRHYCRSWLVPLVWEVVLALQQQQRRQQLMIPL